MTDIACARIDYEGEPPKLTTSQGVEVEDLGGSLKVSGELGDLVLFQEEGKYRLLSLPHGGTSMDVQAINGWNFDFIGGKFTYHADNDRESVTFDCHEPGILDAVKARMYPRKCFEHIYHAKLKLLGIEMLSSISMPHEFARVLASMDAPLHEHESRCRLAEQFRLVRECFEQLLVTGRAKPFNGLLRARDEQTQVLTQQVVDLLRAGYEHVRYVGQLMDTRKMYKTSAELDEGRS